MHIDNDREEDKIESQTKMIMSLVIDLFLAITACITITKKLYIESY